MLIVGRAEPGAKGGAVVFNGAVGKLLENDLSIEIGDGQLERVVLHGDAQFGGGESDCGVALLWCDGDAGGAGGGQDGPGCVFWQFSGCADADAEHVIAQSGYAQEGGSRVDVDSVVRRAESCDPVQTDEAWARRGLGGQVRL